MTSVATVIRRLGHVATRNQLLARGLTGWDIARAVRGGDVLRIRRGWYATTGASIEQLVAVRVGGRVSHLSAARSYGLWAGLDERIHVGLVRGSSRLRAPALPPAMERLKPGVVVTLHWTESGRVDVSSDCTWRVPLPVCLREVVASSDRETAVACLDTALTVFRLTVAQLMEIFTDAPKTSRERAALARVGSDSGPESVARQRFDALGLIVRQQVRFEEIRRVDMRIGRRIIVEVDGRQFHDLSTAYENDRRGDDELVALGYVVLRFTYRQVMFDWPFVERTVLAALSMHP